jgi:cytochrome c5
MPAMGVPSAEEETPATAEEAMPATEVPPAEEAMPAMEVPPAEEAAPAAEEGAPAPAEVPPVEEMAPAEQKEAVMEPPQAQVEEAAGESSMELAMVVPADLDLAHGKQLYNTACVICHQAGVAGAPKLGDKEAWAPRIAQGFDTLVKHSLNGFRGMPPKGGRVDLPDEEFISAVGYMVSQAQ